VSFTLTDIWKLNHHCIPTNSIPTRGRGRLQCSICPPSSRLANIYRQLNTLHGSPETWPSERDGETQYLFPSYQWSHGLGFGGHTTRQISMGTRTH
jgi:hypothetical protein